MTDAPIYINLEPLGFGDDWEFLTKREFLTERESSTMTSIETLRDNVIDAARRIRMHHSGFVTSDVEAIVDAVDALDAALRPDPWQLLRCALAAEQFPEDEIRAALKWHDQQGGEA